jgi:hypothetical protein
VKVVNEQALTPQNWQKISLDDKGHYKKYIFYKYNGTISHVKKW